MLNTYCGIFMKVAAGVALLAFARACHTFTRRILVTTVSFSSIPGPGAVTTNALGAPTNALGAPTITQIVESHYATPPPPELEEVIECGHCHREIKSEPIKQLSDPVKPTEVYRCEHCGSEVMVPL